MAARGGGGHSNDDNRRSLFTAETQRSHHRDTKIAETIPSSGPEMGRARFRVSRLCGGRLSVPLWRRWCQTKPIGEGVGRGRPTYEELNYAKRSQIAGRHGRSRPCHGGGPGPIVQTKPIEGCLPGLFRATGLRLRPPVSPRLASFDTTGTPLPLDGPDWLRLAGRPCHGRGRGAGRRSGKTKPIGRERHPTIPKACRP